MTAVPGSAMIPVLAQITRLHWCQRRKPRLNVKAANRSIRACTVLVSVCAHAIAHNCICIMAMTVMALLPCGRAGA
jgi:hypothetical protein